MVELLVRQLRPREPSSGVSPPIRPQFRTAELAADIGRLRSTEEVERDRQKQAVIERLRELARFD